MARKTNKPFHPTAAQNALLDALVGVRYLRLEQGGPHSLEDAEALERAGMVDLDYKTITGRSLVACVAKLAYHLKPCQQARASQSFVPLKPGTRVNVARHRHGWEPCGRTAVIETSGGKGYMARCEETGALLEINHHRDVTPL